MEWNPQTPKMLGEWECRKPLLPPGARDVLPPAGHIWSSTKATSKAASACSASGWSQEAEKNKMLG